MCGNDAAYLKFHTAGSAYTNPLTITNASWHSNIGTVYSGKLYYWDDDDGSYEPVVNSNKYWYYSDSWLSGTNTVYY